MPAELVSERRGDALVLTLRDPETRNALSAQAIAAGIEALDSSESNPDIRAVVLRGDGAHFCAGGNVPGLAERRAEGRDAQRRMLDHLHHWVEAIRACPKPVIAAVEGTAADAGFSLALACDLIVAAEDARFVLSYAKLGLVPDGGSTWSLARALPRQLVTRLAWLGEPISAEVLQRHGIVAEVTLPGRALDEALELASRLAAMAPNAIAGAKELIASGAEQTLPQQLGAERDAFLDALFHANGEEGLRAFLEQRTPRYAP